jgi:hypothetical protein
VGEPGSCRCNLIERHRTLVLAACLAFLATFAAPAAAGGPSPDPAPKHSSGPAPDPAPQAKPAPARTVTQAASTSQPLPAAVATPPAQPAGTPSHHQASAPAAAPVTRRPVARHVSPTPPAPSVLRRAGRVLGALTFSRLAGEVRALDVQSAASSPDRGLLMLGGAILLLIVLGEVGFLSASVRLLRRAI